MVEQPVSQQEVKFYRTRDAYGCFSNFSAHPFELEGLEWPTAEHYFQAKKFAGTEIEQVVRASRSPMDAARLGRDASLPLRPDWDQVKVDVMRRALMAKFSQNSGALEVLLSTGSARIVEHTQNDAFWGDGGDGTGRNMLGELLMEVRSVLVSTRY